MANRNCRRRTGEWVERVDNFGAFLTVCSLGSGSDDLPEGASTRVMSTR